MSLPIHVAVVDLDPNAGAALADSLGGYGCTVIHATPHASLDRELRAHDPHVIVLHGGDSAAALDVALALKRSRDMASTPIILLGGDGDQRARALDAGIDAVLPSRFSDAELYTRLRAFARLKTMRSELARRDATQRRYGLSRDPLTPDPTPSADTVSILVAGDLGTDAERLSVAVGEQSRLSFADDPASTIDALNVGAFDAAVVAVKGAPGAWLTMCGDVRKNPRLFNLPILLIADADCFPDLATPYEAGASDLLLQPLSMDELRVRLTTLVRQHRDRQAMQQAYHRSQCVETGDALTGLYSFGYLHDYLASLIADAQRSDNDLTVALLNVKAMAVLNRKYGYAGGDGLLRQVGGLIGLLMRAEDLTARYGGDTFCLVMPDTPGGAGETALCRIRDIIEQTEFGVHTSGEAVTIGLKMGSATLQPDDTAESLLARALETTR